MPYFCWRLLWWKMGRKGHIFIVIRKSFLNDCSPQWSSYSLCIQLCLLNINNISKGHFGSLGGTMYYLGFNVLGKGVAKFKLLYNDMKMISLQNIFEKIINDIIALFLFNILKLLCSFFCTLTLIFFINVRIEWFGESHLRATVYKFT